FGLQELFEGEDPAACRLGMIIARGTRIIVKAVYQNSLRFRGMARELNNLLNRNSGPFGDAQKSEMPVMIVSRAFEQHRTARLNIRQKLLKRHVSLLLDLAADLDFPIVGRTQFVRVVRTDIKRVRRRDPRGGLQESGQIDDPPCIMPLAANDAGS